MHHGTWRTFGGGGVRPQQVLVVLDELCQFVPRAPRGRPPPLQQRNSGSDTVQLEKCSLKWQRELGRLVPRAPRRWLPPLHQGKRLSVSDAAAHKAHT